MSVRKKKQLNRTKKNVEMVDWGAGKTMICSAQSLTQPKATILSGRGKPTD